MFHHTGRIFLSACVVLTLVSPAWAQEVRTGLHGFVLNTEGGKVSAVAGATVRFLKGNGEAAASATTDQRGYYRASLIAGEYIYEVNAAGYKPEKSGRGFAFRLSEGYTVYNFTLIKGKEDPNAKPETPPDIPFNPIGELRGQVYEKTEEGELKGVNGAVVTLRNSVGPAQPKQVFTSPPSELGELPSGYKLLLAAGSWKASISAPGFDTLVHPERITVEADKMAIQDFILTRPAPSKQGIRGYIKVAGKGKEPLPPSVKVTIKRGDADGASKNPVTFEPEVDQEGQFEQEIRVGRYIVTAEAPDYESATEFVTVLPKSFTTVTLTLKKAKTLILVTVLDAESKKPLGKATVRARQPSEPISKAAMETADAKGEATFAPKAAGKWQVLAQFTGYAPAGKEVAILSGKTARVELLLRKEKATPIVLTVMVQDPKKAPVADAKVVIAAQGEPGPELPPTKANGETSRTLPAFGAYQVSVSRPGFDNYVQVVQVRQEATRHVLTLYPYVRLKLTVVQGGTKAPVADASVAAVHGKARLANITNREGVTLFKFSDADTVDLQVIARGFAPFKGPLKVERGDNDRTIVLNPSSLPPVRLQLAVKDTAGRVLPEAQVAIDPPVGPSVVRFTGFEGVLLEEFAEPGAFTVQVRKAGYNPANAVVKLVRGDNPRQVVLSIAKSIEPIIPNPTNPNDPPPPLPKGDFLVIQVVDGKTGAGIPGASIRLVDGRKSLLQGQSNELGSFRERTPTGSFQLLVSRAPYQPFQEAITIGKGGMFKKVSLNRDVTASNRTINVLVREAGKANVVPVESAEVRILSEGGKVVRTGKTNGLGRFRADKMPVGTYVVYADKVGFTQLNVPRSDITKGDDQPEVLLSPKGGTTKPKPPPTDVLVTVPNVVGTPKLRSQTIIDGAGLKYAATNPTATGAVKSQTPVAGTKVAKGTTVTVTFDQPAPPTMRTLTVAVLEARTRKLVGNSTVTVKGLGKNANVTRTVTTDPKGNVTVPNLPPGAYVVEARARGWELFTSGRADVTNDNGRAEVFMQKGIIVN